MFRKMFAMKKTNIFSEYTYKVPCVKTLILGKLLGARYLFETLQSSFTAKISKNVKRGFF